MDYQGAFTGCNLNDLTSLSMPWRTVNGQLQPPFSQEAAQLSLELAATAYDQKMDRWRQAGWQDISCQSEGILRTDIANEIPARKIGGRVSEYICNFAKTRLRRQLPIQQLHAVLHTQKKENRCKVVVMSHPLGAKQYMIAIGFMGTTKQFSDWASNFRLANTQGVHQGFLQLTEDFEALCSQIPFPKTAQELGLSQLTLADILDECHRPGSRFRIWLAGHSQGGAVMQLFALREIRRGLLRQNLIGYGFASPSVLYASLPGDITNFPLYHIQNGDDLIPRVGATLHVGRCRLLHPQESMRAKCYHEAWMDPAFRQMLNMMRSIPDTGHALAWLIALLRAIEQLPDAEAMAMIAGMAGRFIPERFIESIGGRIDELLHGAQAKVAAAYRQITTKEELPECFINRMQRRIERLLSDYGAKNFMKTFFQSTSLPHKLRGSMQEPASYQYIVNHCFQALQQGFTGTFAPRACPAVQRQVLRSLPASRFARLSQRKNQRARKSAFRSVIKEGSCEY